MAIRCNISDSQELKNIALADIVLVIAFSLTLSGGVSTFLGQPSAFAARFAYLVPIVALGVTLSFVLHELMHKFVAQHYGAIAGFRTSYNGLLITLLTGALGFLLGIPGATMIYASRFTERENGIVSLAGPATNFVVFLLSFAAIVGLGLQQGSYLYDALKFTVFISLLLAFFNMLPIPPLDGSKVLAWDRGVYIISIVALLALLGIFTSISVYSLLFMVLIAFIFSNMYRLVI